jgi:hypothetical protein
MNWFEVVRPARTAVALSVALLVAACGGGGGGDNAQNDGNGATPQSSQSVSVAGVASKGLLKNAVVKVYALNADGSIGALLATTRTDATGHYQTPGLTGGTLVYLEVTADDKTLMADEATGLDLRPSKDFKLRALKTLSKTAGSDALQITPFSEMAASIAELHGGFKPDSVDAANQQVVKFFQYEVLTTEPIFDAKNKPMNAAALSLAAVSGMAKSGAFANCLGESSAMGKVECVVSELKLRSTANSELIAKLESAKDDVRKAGYKGDTAPAVQSQLPAPLAANAKDGIAEAKALIKNVRSNADKSVTDVLSQRFKSVQDQLRVGVAPIDDQGAREMLAVAQAAAVLDNPARELGTAFKGTFGGADLGCTLYNKDGTPASSYADVKTVTCVVQQGRQYGPSSASSVGEYTSSQDINTHLVNLSKTPTAGSYAVQSTLYTQELVHHRTVPYQVCSPTSCLTIGNDSQWDTLGPNTAQSNVNAALVTLSSGASGAPYGTMTLKGSLAPSAHIMPMMTDRIDVDLTMTVTAVGSFTRVGLKGGIVSLVNGGPSAKAVIADGSYLQLRTTVPGDIGADMVDDQSGALLHVAVASVSPGGASVVGMLEVGNIVYSSAKQNGHGNVSFEGVLKQADDSLLFDGKITLIAPKDPVLVQGQDPLLPDGSIQFDGILPILQHPDMVVHLTTTTNRSSVHSFAGSYTQKNSSGTAEFLIKGTVDESTGVLQSLTLSTPSGVTATVHPNDTSFQIKKGTDVLGVFTKSDGRILYADNTYEQY